MRNYLHETFMMTFGDGVADVDITELLRFHRSHGRLESFWQCIDKLRDKVLLEALWDSGDPPWKVWS